jgi:uncharacterized membrane protein
MGQHRVLPNGKWIAFQNDAGQPRNAMIVTGVMIFASMLLRELNVVATAVTMFFLITYAMLNVVVIIEQRLGLISFRPKFTVHWLIPYLGLGGSLFAMFIINPTVSLISWSVVIFVYGLLSQLKLESQFEDVRSGLFTSFAEWAAKHTADTAHEQERSWKPNMLVPVTDAVNVQGSFSIIKDIAHPRGSAVLMGIGDQDFHAERKQLDYISGSFKKANVFSSVIMMQTDVFGDGVNFGNQALKGSYFRPNVIFLNMLEDEKAINDYPSIIREAERLNLGVVLYMPHRKAMLGQKQIVNIWIRNRAPEWDLKDTNKLPNLSLLIAYKLKQNWNCITRVIMVIEKEEQRQRAELFIHDLIDKSRLPIDEVHILVSEVPAAYSEAPIADVNMFGLFDEFDAKAYRDMTEKTKTSCLFVMNSGHENIFA